MPWRGAVTDVLRVIEQMFFSFVIQRFLIRLSRVWGGEGASRGPISTFKFHYFFLVHVSKKCVQRIQSNN